MARISEKARRRIPRDFELSTAHSGFARHLGPYYVAIIATDAGEAEYWHGLKIDERHAGRAGGKFGHGGILLAMLDESMGRAASRAAGMVCATVSMQTQFCAPFYQDDFLRASASVTRRGRNLVFMEGIVYCADEIIGTASGVWANTGEALPD